MLLGDQSQKCKCESLNYGAWQRAGDGKGCGAGGGVESSYLVYE